jgi:hypothetical protein
MTSKELRKLNAYPEWKTIDGINDVKLYVATKDTLFHTLNQKTIKLSRNFSQLEDI